MPTGPLEALNDMSVVHTILERTFDFLQRISVISGVPVDSSGSEYGVPVRASVNSFCTEYVSSSLFLGLMGSTTCEIKFQIVVIHY